MKTKNDIFFSSKIANTRSIKRNLSRYLHTQSKISVVLEPRQKKFWAHVAPNARTKNYTVLVFHKFCLKALRVLFGDQNKTLREAWCAKIEIMLNLFQYFYPIHPTRHLPVVPKL